MSGCEKEVRADIPEMDCFPRSEAGLHRSCIEVVFSAVKLIEVCCIQSRTESLR